MGGGGVKQLVMICTQNGWSLSHEFIQHPTSYNGGMVIIQ